MTDWTGIRRICKVDTSLNYGRRLIRKFLRDAAPFDSVLDIGSGKGDDLLYCREICPSADLAGIDLNEENLKVLPRQGMRGMSVNIESDPIPFSDGSVQVIIINQVLEHVKEIFWVWHEMTRVLQPGGSILVGVPNLASLHNRLLLVFGRQPTAIHLHSAHIRGYTREGLMNFLTRIWPGGYTVAGRGGSNFYPFPAALAKPLARLFPGLAWGLFLSLRKSHRPYSDEFIRYPVDNRLETKYWVGQ